MFGDVEVMLPGSTTCIGTTPGPNAATMAAGTSGLPPLSKTSTGFVGLGAPARAQMTALLTKLHWSLVVAALAAQWKSMSWPVSSSRPALAAGANATAPAAAISAGKVQRTTRVLLMPRCQRSPIGRPESSRANHFSTNRPPTMAALDDWVSQQARLNPEGTAVSDGARGLTYAELTAAASTTARRLAAAGVGERDRVATGLPAGLEFAVLLHALPRLGG